MTDLTLHHADILDPGTDVHLTRATVLPRRPKQLHKHDFVEVFWVQNGTIRHHTADEMTKLDEGTLVVIPKGVTHALQGKGDHAMVVMLCLSPKLTTHLAKRHPDVAGILQGDGVKEFKRDPRQMATLNQTALRLERSTRDTLAAEAFLLPLLSELRDGPDPSIEMPDWLRKACTDIQDPALFRDGAAGFVALTGKAHPHVSRTMKACTGQTPVQYINNLRMEHAARALTGSNESLAEIADEIGLPNLSHFHKTFRARFKVTPAQYRADRQRHVVQPE